MIRTAEGEEIWRSVAPPATWQYWKFVWRSSVFLYITLIDHLWMTHYSAGNALAASSREGLPPAHPLRRLLTMFTHGTIAVNGNAIYQLTGPHALLQRSSPFHDFHEVAKAAQSSMMSMKEAYGVFSDDSLFSSLDSALQELPFYEDGRLLFDGIGELVDKWVELYSSEWCDGDLIKDADIEFFMKRMQAWSLSDHTANSDHEWLGLYAPSGELKCTGFYQWLKIQLFAVSGYHRQVGTVADIASDPDFASFSNVEGEAFGRPRQHMQMALIAGSTAMVFPKISTDFSFLAEGLGASSAAASQILKDFQSQMLATIQKVNERNQVRSDNGGSAYLQMHPEHVESSVAV